MQTLISLQIRNLALLLLCLPTAAGAADLEDSYRAALSRSEQVATQEALLEQQDEVFSQARGSLLPSVIAFGSYLIQATPQNSVGSQISPSTQPLARVSANQPLFRGFREFAGIRQASRLVEAQENAWRAAATQLYVDVAGSFYSLVALEKNFVNIQEEISLHDRRLKDLGERVKIGRSRQSEVLTVRATQASLRAQQAALEGQIKSQRALFTFLTGFGPEVPVQDSETLPASVAIDSYVSGLGSRPDVQAEEKRLEAAGEGVSIARGAHLPSADVNGNYYLKRVGSLRDVDWDVQFVLSLPLFQGGVLSSRVRASEAARTAAELSLSRVRRLAEQEIRATFDVYQSDLKQLEAFEEANELAKRNYEMQLREYRLGLVTNLEVVTALAASEQNRRSLNSAKAAVKLDFVRLEAAGARRPGNLPKREQ